MRTLYKQLAELYQELAPKLPVFEGELCDLLQEATIYYLYDKEGDTEQEALTNALRRACNKLRPRRIRHMNQAVKEVPFGLRFDGYADESNDDWEEILVEKRFISDTLSCGEAAMIEMVMSGLTHQQIAGIYGISRSAVTKRIQKTKKKLIKEYRAKK